MCLGAHGQVTSDHVPPKCLFAPQVRTNLLTVNACPTCHDSFKLDDEYFKVVLGLRADLPKNSESEFLQNQTSRTLNSEGADGFRAMLRQAMRKVPLYTSAGIYLGHAPGIDIDVNRVRSTTERLVKGLFAKFFHRVLPPTHAVVVTPLDFQRDSSALRSADVREGLIALGEHGKRRTFGRTFDVWYLNTVEDQNSTLWWIQLHGVFGVFGFTVPRET